MSTRRAGGADTRPGRGADPVRRPARAPTTSAAARYYYLQHDKLNANTWFNNRDLPPDPATGKAPKNELRLYQPGMRVGGPIVIPGLCDGRNKAFFFVNYEESRSPGQSTREPRTILHPRRRAGHLPLHRGGRRAARSTCCSSPAANGQLATVDPTIAQAARRHPQRRPAPAAASPTSPTRCCSGSRIQYAGRRASRSIRPAARLQPDRASTG